MIDQYAGVNVNSINNSIQRELFSIYLEHFNPFISALLVTQNIVESANFTSGVFIKNNNIGGVTWSPNLGLKGYQKGTSRPASEGGFYINFTSYKECAKFIVDLYKRAYYSSLSSISIKDFVYSIKNQGLYGSYFGSSESGYVAMLEGQKRTKLDPYLRNILDNPGSYSKDLENVSVTAKKKQFRN